jgi:hypothetical protein
MSPSDSAKAILDAIVEGKRELILATGMELEIAHLRRRDPDALFDATSSMVREGYAAAMNAKADAS